MKGRRSSTPGPRGLGAHFAGGRAKAAAADDVRAPSVHNRIKRTPAKERLHDTSRHVDDGYACIVINGRKYTP